jgi:hypothetical protein
MKKPLLLARFAIYSCSEVVVAKEKKSSFFLEYLDYEDRAYSQNQKTQLGEEVELDAALRYQYNENTFARFRFETDPEENSVDNKTSLFEIRASHRHESVLMALDLEINSSDNSDGSTSLGIDTDSEDSYIKWDMNDSLSLHFFPFNFNGEVGKEFSTWDVTRIYSIEGIQAPDTINYLQNTATITQKTIPGIIIDTKLSDKFNFYFGGGVASYLYPTDSDFDLTDSNQRFVTRWKRKQDFGYQIGFEYRNPKHARIEFKYVGHTEAEETGSLLESAGSIYGIKRQGPVFLEGEVTYTRAGSRPWRLSRTSGWFEQTTSPGFQPVYSTYNGDTQDWVGKAGYGIATRAGFEIDDITLLYGLFRFQTKHMVYHRENESAHILRDADEEKSHGGLTRVGLGSFLRYGKFTVQPEFEYMMAENHVFADYTSSLQDRNLATFSKTDYLITLFVKYNFEGVNPFTP